MKLNNDCVRNILLFIEANQTSGKTLHVESIIKSLKLTGYKEDEIKYALSKLNETPYVNFDLTEYNGLVLDGISGALTWEGHQFLDNIRNKSTWENVKSNIKEKVGNASITIIAAVAESYIKNKLGLN
ncbi:DUF2513 domain-containing protein [Lactobacillus gasseri]|uniref:DUF2513 domain-containing protein n=1 Tax=Lactobacillus gasseri TaxID=1596 RepID=UPI002072C77F|nr:DUF2513 domain-containing protein [Lactobacillus gasseri]